MFSWKKINKSINRTMNNLQKSRRIMGGYLANSVKKNSKNNSVPFIIVQFKYFSKLSWYASEMFGNKNRKNRKVSTKNFYVIYMRCAWYTKYKTFIGVKLLFLIQLLCIESRILSEFICLLMKN